jgi:hypothetical protein
MKNGMTRKRLIVMCLSIIGFSIAIVFFVLWYNQAVASRASSTAEQTKKQASQVTPSAQTAPSPSPAPVSSTPSVSAAEKAAVIDSYNDKYAYPILGKSFCHLMNSGAYEQDLGELTEVTYLPEQEALHQYLAYANESCIDGSFNLGEYAEIVEIHDHVANSEGNVLRWHRTLAFVEEMYHFLDGIFTNCSSINELTVEEFSHQLSATIAMYSGPNIGDDLPDIFSAQKLQCSE